MREIGALDKSIQLRNSKVNYKTIFYWTSSLASPSSLLKVPIVSVNKAVQENSFNSTPMELLKIVLCSRYIRVTDVFGSEQEGT